MKKVVNNSLPFLDVFAIKSGFSLKREVFRKPMKIDSIIPVTASTSWVYRMSAFNYFIKRAQIVCSDEFLEDKLNHIVKINIGHGYNPQVIQKLIEKFNSYPPIRSINL